MFRWLPSRSAVEAISDGILCQRQQRAQAFYQHQRRFGTRAPFMQPAISSEIQHGGNDTVNALPSAQDHSSTYAEAHTRSSTARLEHEDVTPAVPAVAKSRAESRLERKARRLSAGTYKPLANTMKEPDVKARHVESVVAKMGDVEAAEDSANTIEDEAPEDQRVQSILAKLEDLEESSAPVFSDVVPLARQAKKEPKQDKRGSSKDARLQLRPRRDPWELQKDALVHKFGESGWQPRKRLSPDTLDGIRALHASDPASYSTEMLSEHFKIAPEAIRRILKSKWRPNEGETEDRRTRWERRGVKKWQEMAGIGMRPPVKWRAMGVGGAAGVVEERMPKRKKPRRPDEGLSWDEVVGGALSEEERVGSSLAERLL
ncbi:Required for respiratory growth protein 9 mitochondrial [Elasticomyces elasticus]|uniref:Required for respiratory growth protein 9, mitochondrial n=1 Tax=Elasticomyces elasticus TaxID=574655 RepID=A0AAN7WA93_9PEZI|nr:Required for respiratory growth protein 9 mitochondrial [Elasticomyces elasticus]